ALTRFVAEGRIALIRPSCLSRHPHVRVPCRAHPERTPTGVAAGSSSGPMCRPSAALSVDDVDLLETLTDVITTLAGSPWVFPIVLALCIVDGFFPPVPSETVVVAAATLSVATGAPNLPLLIVVAAVGAAAGDNIAYWIGRAVGTTRFRWMRLRRVASAIELARRGIRRRGALLIFAARYIPVGRIAVNMTAGATHYPVRRF